MKPPAPGQGTVRHDLDDLLGHLLRKGALAGQRAFAEAFGATDLSPVQYGLLCVVLDNPGVAHKALAQAIAAAPSIVTTALKPLLAEGLVVQSLDPDDARSSRYRLSPKGRGYLARLRPRIADAERRLGARLAAGEAAELRALLAKLIGATPHAPP